MDIFKYDVVAWFDSDWILFFWFAAWYRRKLLQRVNFKELRNQIHWRAIVVLEKIFHFRRQSNLSLFCRSRDGSGHRYEVSNGWTVPNILLLGRLLWPSIASVTTGFTKSSLFLSCGECIGYAVPGLNFGFLGRALPVLWCHF